MQQPAEVEQGGHQHAVSSRPLAPRVASTLHHTAVAVVSADVGNHQPSPLEWSGAHVVIVSPTPQTSALGAVGSSPPPVLTQRPKPFVCFFSPLFLFFYFNLARARFLQSKHLQFVLKVGKSSRKTLIAMGFVFTKI